jgi:3-oxoadipate enol-lactonase
LTSTPILSHEEKGQGTPIVLLHGFPFDHTIWRQQLDGVTENARVLAPDLPGFGQSAPLSEPDPGMQHYAGRLAQWVGAVGLDRFVLVGHSMGGYIAFAFARQYPHMLSGLGLVCTRPDPDTEQARQGRYALIAAVRERGPQAVVDAMLPRLFAPRTKETNPELVEQVRELMLRQGEEGIVSAIRAMASRPDSTPMLEKIEVPTLVVSGAQDVIIPAELADLMAATIPGARQETIEDAGHLPMMEQPATLSSMLRDLVRGSSTNPEVPEPPDPHDIAGARTRD